MSYRIPYFVDSAFAAIALGLVIFKIKEPEGKHVESAGLRGQPDGKGGDKFSLTRPLKILMAYTPS